MSELVRGYHAWLNGKSLGRPATAATQAADPPTIAPLRNDLKLSTDWRHLDLSADNYFLMPLSFYYGIETIERATPLTRTDQNFGIGADQRESTVFYAPRYATG